MHDRSSIESSSGTADLCPTAEEGGPATASRGRSDTETDYRYPHGTADSHVSPIDFE